MGLEAMFFFYPIGIAPVERVVVLFNREDTRGYMEVIVRDGQLYAGEANFSLAITPENYTKIVKAAEQALRAEQARRKAAREGA